MTAKLLRILQKHGELSPPYSLEFNRIEKAFSRLKAMFRKIGKLVDIFQLLEGANYFSSCGYDPD